MNKRNNRKKYCFAKLMASGEIKAVRIVRGVRKQNKKNSAPVPRTFHRKPKERISEKFAAEEARNERRVK